MADNKTLGLVIGGVGLGIVVIALASGGGKKGQPWPAGDAFGAIAVPELDNMTGGPIRLSAGQVLGPISPAIAYSGPGRDLFTYFSIHQQQGKSDVTVYGSGVAGVHVGPSTSLTAFRLVSDTQQQPVDGTCNRGGKNAGPWMCAYPWKDPHIDTSTPICGAPPVAGPADILIECYLKASDSLNPADADGFSSPTCYRVNGNPRLPLRDVSRRYAGVVLFV